MRRRRMSSRRAMRYWNATDSLPPERFDREAAKRQVIEAVRRGLEARVTLLDPSDSAEFSELFVTLADNGFHPQMEWAPTDAVRAFRIRHFDSPLERAKAAFRY